MTAGDELAQAHAAYRAYIHAMVDLHVVQLHALTAVELDGDPETLGYLARAQEIRDALAARLDAIDQAWLALSKSRLDEQRGIPPGTG